MAISAGSVLQNQNVVIGLLVLGMLVVGLQREVLLRGLLH